MKKAVAKDEDEFLFKGDTWSGILGKKYKNKIEDFLRTGIEESRYTEKKLIYHNVYTFIEWKPNNSPIAFGGILENIVENNEPSLSFVTGFPILEGKKNKLNITCIRDHKESDKLEGYIGLSYAPEASDMMAYNPLHARQHFVFNHLKRNKKGNFQANICVAGLALSIKKSPKKIIKVDKGGFYEVVLKRFLEENPDKTQADFPYAEVDASHVSGFFSKTCKDCYEFVSDIYSIKKFKFYDMDFYRLEIEVLRGIEIDKGLKIYLYINKELLGKYEPKLGDNINGIMQLTAYIDDKECSKIMKASMEDGEIITEKGRFQYKFEVPVGDEEFATGLAFRDDLAPQTGLLYLYDNEYASMFTAQTKIPVDYIFTDLCGNIIKIARNVEPLSYENHFCHNTCAVLEINKGETDKFGMKEGDVVLNKHLFPNFDYGKLTVKNADKYYRYDIDLYAEKSGMLYFYSYRCHEWNMADDDSRKELIGNRMKNYAVMGIERIHLTEEETENLMNKYENELRSDYATTLKRYYRLCEKLFYSHDEINDTYQLYTFKNGWIDIDWLRNAHELIDPFRKVALKTTSIKVESLIEEYQKSVEKDNYKDDVYNISYMYGNEPNKCEDKFYLVFGGTLWRINNDKNIYQTYHEISDSWKDMNWLGDKLEHEVECTKVHGVELSYVEMLKKCQELRQSYLKRNKNKK